MKVKGWKSVMSFTFIQNVKAKSFIAGTVVMCIIFSLIAVGINILPKLITGGSFDNFFGQSTYEKISTVFLYDTTDFGFNEEAKQLGISIVDISEAELDAKQKEVEQSNAAVVLLKIIQTENSFDLTIYRPHSEEVISGGDCQALADAVGPIFTNAMYKSYGLSEDDIKTLQFSVNSEVKLYSDEQSNLSQMQKAMASLLPILSALVFFSFIISYANMIAQSVATEKTSRVMELLLTSVRPLAVIVGKVVAMLFVCLAQFLAIGFVTGLAFLISAPFGFIPDLIASGEALISQGMAQTGAAAATIDFGTVVNEITAQIGSSLPGLDIFSIILVIIVFVLGFLFFALLAGLCGASVSRAEDLATAIQPLTMVSMIGFLISYMPSIIAVESTLEGGGPDAITIVARYLPISSPFSLPAGILLGQMSMLEACISVLVLAVFVVLTALLVSKIYHHIVLYSGNPLKFNQLIKFAKKN